MGDRIKVVTGKTISAAGSNMHTITFPRDWIEKIHINIGTAITVSAGAVVANCSLKTIVLRYNGNQIMYLTGLSYDDLQSAGMQLLRELNAQIARIAAKDDFWAIPFKHPLPPGDLQLQFTNQTAEQIGADAAATVTAGDHNIYYEKAKPAKSKPIIPYWYSGLFSHTDLASQFFDYLPSFPHTLRILGFVTHDGGTRADDTFDSLQIQHKGQILFDDDLPKLQDEWQQKSGIALNTGCFFKSFGANGINVAPDTFLMLFTAGTAGTAKFIEWIALCY